MGQGRAESTYERDQKILELRAQGHSYRVIGRQVGMSGNGVMHVVNRLNGRQWDDDDEEYYAD